jgi:Haem-binding domain
MNWARVKRVAFALAVFLILIQIFQPERTNPPAVPSRFLTAHVPIPIDVHTALMRACGDCHSNQTRWPWYGHIAPFSWVITDDVNQGRRHMNFDDWEAEKSPKQANDTLIDICKEVQQNGMPPFSYRLTHRKSRLKSKEITSICSWSRSFETNQNGSDSRP